ncbi:uncharacterized protein LOC110029412 [Phalaenopsis equestris]|uniref:uncharacterized protein LOC110029412 n=1 Tax=Phalaenopsis equestris TaxID=78828 RepID=UPI0009E1CCBF|nr:uncharacterized protein LOC110029412 [Phalaenopsis equestris]
MNSSVPLDCAFFELSPRRTRCELFVSEDGKTEKLASGFLKPFLTHLKVAEEQACRDVPLINLEVGRRKNAATWFNKGTVERFVRFVSTPEVLELVNTLDAEMSQLEGARKMYSQGARDQLFGESETKSAAAVDATKKELLRAIDGRLLTVKQDLATACARASAAGFNLESVSELLLFADQFGAIRLSEACKSFLSLPQRQPELISHQQSMASQAIHPQWKSFNDANVRSSSSSDMSIDEPEVEQTDPAKSATFHSDAQLHSLSSYKQQKQAVDGTNTATTEKLKPNSQHLVDKVLEKVDDRASGVVSSAKFMQQAGGSKRLTVQDRINLFESKQKEQSANPNIGGGSFGGPTVGRLSGTRGEHRRNQSDVSVEKLVLRRWSGASDMSIDLNSNSTSSTDRKESGSTAGTPTSANLQHQITTRSSENDDRGLTEASKSCARLGSKNSLLATSSTFSTSQGPDGTFPNGRESQSRDAVHKQVIASANMEPPGFSKEEQPNAWNHMNCSLEGLEHGEMCVEIVSQSRTKGFSNSREVVITREPAASQTNSRSTPAELVYDQMVSQIPCRAPPALAVPSELKNQANLLAQHRDQSEVDGIAAKTQRTSGNKFRSFAGKMEDTGLKSMGDSDSQIQFKPSMGKIEDISAKDDSEHPKTQGSGFNEVLMATHTTFTAPQVPSQVFSAKARQGSASVGSRVSGKPSGTDKKFQEGGGELVHAEDSSVQPFQGRKINEGMEAPFSHEDSQAARLNRDNHELNDALHLKAEELEKLFAEHKLKNHVDQISSARRRKTLLNHSARSLEKKSALSPTKQKPEKSLLRPDSSNVAEFDSDLLPGMIENFDLCDANLQKIGNHLPTDVPRGKLYGKYMQRRDAKLSQECGSKKAQKEAKMKAMHDSLELSHAEMKAKFASFSDRQNLTSSRHRQEKMRSFNARSTLQVKDQFCSETSGSFTGDGDADDRELSESSIGNQSNKLLSSTFFTSVSHTSKHLVKSTNSNSSRHRGQSGNLVAQSVLTFSDLKNENVKPLAVVTKAMAHEHPRSLSINKSSIKDAEISKEDLRWSNHMRKNSVTPAEPKDLSSPNSDNTLHNIQMSYESKRYLKKGNGVNHGSGAVMGKSRSSIAAEELRSKEKSEEIVSPKEDSLDMAIDDEEFQSAYAERNNLIMDLPIDSNGEKPRHSQLSGEPESENGDLIRPQSHLDDSSIIYSKFSSSRNAEDSAEESSRSLTSHIYHSHAYTREASDIYATSDFNTDCTSWNSHSLNHIVDSEAARMRKKWGSAQIPVISASASQQSRRDVTKGFKRLLNFGRKNRGADYLVNDWFSASTASEGDDDTEDGRDLVHRPTEDLRKSRMGYSTTYDGYNDGDIFPEQAHSLRNSNQNPPTNFRLRDDHLSGNSLKAPRSFFSLSSFRSKAGDSKPR